MSLRYAIEYCQNPDVIIIHLDKKLVRTIFASDMMDEVDGEDSLLKPDFCGKNVKALARSLRKIKGVVEFSMTPYNLQAGKGAVFSWYEILPKLLKTINKNLNPRGKMVEKTIETREEMPVEAETSLDSPIDPSRN